MLEMQGIFDSPTWIAWVWVGITVAIGLKIVRDRVRGL